MKLCGLDKGDRFKLAGDDNSPVFTFDHLDGIYGMCLYKEKKEFKLIRFLSLTPILRVKE